MFTIIISHFWRKVKFKREILYRNGDVSYALVAQDAGGIYRYCFARHYKRYPGRAGCGGAGTGLADRHHHGESYFT